MSNDGGRLSGSGGICKEHEIVESFRTISVEVNHRGVAAVRLAREATLNAFDETMIAELTEAYVRLAARSDVRVVVLRSEGRAFCAGADLQWMRRASENGPAENLEDARRFARMMQAIRRCPKPTIASVQGHAFGGGVGLCAACDIVIASDQARFSVSEARFGILPAVIGPYLVEAVGQRQARRLALTSVQISAEEALRIGLTHRTVSLDELDDAVHEAVSDLLRNGPAALTEIKRYFDEIGEYRMSDQVHELAAQTISRVRSGDEAREGFAAFFAKRSPAWVGGM
jgi:methylglutaconyl-CoA hydratase